VMFHLYTIGHPLDELYEKILPHEKSGFLGG
jgi:hypothetical protein